MVEAKSLALICTKDQNSFLFFYLEPKDIFPTKSQMKKRNKRKINKPRKEPPPKKKKKTTEHLSGQKNQQLPNDFFILV